MKFPIVFVTKVRSVHFYDLGMFIVHEPTMHCSNFDFVGNTPTEDRLWIARPKYAAASMLVSSDGQITTWTTSFINNCDRCCVVNQQDGKILQLGN